ncbi:MAG: PilZ domain-containing protein [Desulfobacterales bacterium]|nr:MAG: PilZ domain-containing protein [Desulfobacterales bacterium]
MGNDNSAFDTDEVSNRLFELISSMPEAEKQDLLEVLEIMHASKRKERRKHHRNIPLMNMDLLMHEIVLKNCIQNISKAGVLIETTQSFSVGQKLSMAIQLAGKEDAVQLGGTIVRVDSDGVAIEFDETISEI